MSNGLGNYFYRSGAGGSGSGSGFGAINYITNFGAETDTTGWATYNDGAQNIPVDGTGGSATNLTFSRSTSSPLVSTASFSLVQANSTSLQGKGVSFDFTIDAAMQATNLSIQFLYNASSTFVTGDGITAPLNDGTVTTNAGNSDIEVFIYDVTNAVLIPVSPQVMTGKGTNNFPFKATFQTASNSTSYRLIFHVATASANATGWTFKFDQVFVGPQSQFAGSPVTDPVAYTPVFTGFGTVSAVNVVSWRDGAMLKIQGAFTAGTTTATEARITLGYNGISGNVTSVSTLPTLQVCGSCVQNTSSTTYFGTYTAIEASKAYLVFTRQTSTQDGTTKQNGSGLFGTGALIEFTAEVPITGFSSTVTMSNDTDTRVVGALYNGTPTGTLNGSLNTATFPTVVSDTHGAYAAGTYTVPVSGLYSVTAQVLMTSTNVAGSSTAAISVFVNGVEKYTWIEVASSTAVSEPKVSVSSIPLVAGDLITIRCNSSGSSLSYTSNTVRNFFSINRLSGPSAIAATDTVAAAYTDTAASVIATSYGKYAFATKVFDTHSAYGNSGIYTVPISGKYLISSILGTAATTQLVTSAFQMIVLQNNTQKFAESTWGNGAAATYSVQAMGLLSCVAGDTLAIQVRSTNIGSTACNAAGTNYFSINRIGN